MRLRVNGRDHDGPDDGALVSLFDQLGLVAGSVVVELNGEALTRAQAAAVRLREGDVLELVRAVAGG